MRSDDDAGERRRDEIVARVSGQGVEGYFLHYTTLLGSVHITTSTGE